MRNVSEADNGGKYEVFVNSMIEKTQFVELFSYSLQCNEKMSSTEARLGQPRRPRCGSTAHNCERYEKLAAPHWTTTPLHDPPRPDAQPNQSKYENTSKEN